jgi:hypothetical protein
VDPHAVLGLPPDASPDEVHRAYRALAKRFHPDRVGAKEGEMMISINAAYDLLRDRLEEAHGGDAPRGAAAAPTSSGAGPDPDDGTIIAGAWLAPAVRRVLARELLQALEPGEQVEDVILTSTSDAHDVQLALTDRRLLWLRDDAIMGRVRSIRYRDLHDVQAKRARFGNTGQLRVRSGPTGRWMRFFDLRPEVLQRLTTRISTRAHA